MPAERGLPLEEMGLDWMLRSARPMLLQGDRERQVGGAEPDSNHIVDLLMAPARYAHKKLSRLRLENSADGPRDRSAVSLSRVSQKQLEDSMKTFQGFLKVVDIRKRCPVGGTAVGSATISHIRVVRPLL
ncbi:hypothetical protein ACIBCO_34105 [Streptomyces violascens]|uniref:hypothetical protein n=1 Tax=Streptomyces violascens TaxID=67381 RepID=UPI00378F48F9